MATKTTGFVVQLSNGDIRLYASEAQAMAHEARLPEDVGIVMSAAVNAAAHYRGKIGASGVRFEKNDVSTAQLLGAMFREADGSPVY